MARLTLSANVVVDRHYLGAIILRGTTTFAVSEEVAEVIDRVSAGAAIGEADDELVSMLIDKKVVVRAP